MSVSAESDLHCFSLHRVQLCAVLASAEFFVLRIFVREKKLFAKTFQPVNNGSMLFLFRKEKKLKILQSVKYGLETLLCAQ